MEDEENHKETFFIKVFSRLGCAGKIKEKSKKKKRLNKSMFDVRMEDNDEPSWELNKTKSMSHDCVFSYGSSFYLAGIKRNQKEKGAKKNLRDREIIINNEYLCRSAYDNEGFIDSLKRREKSISESYETLPENNMSAGQCNDKMLRRLEQRRNSSSNILQNRITSDYFEDDDDAFLSQVVFNKSTSEQSTDHIYENIQAIKTEELESNNKLLSRQFIEPGGEIDSSEREETETESGTYFRLNRHERNHDDIFYRPLDNYLVENRFTDDTSMELKMADDRHASNKMFFQNDKQMFYDPAFEEIFVQNMQPASNFNALKTRWRASVNSNHDSAIGSDIDDNDSMTLFVLTSNQNKTETADQKDYRMKEEINTAINFQNKFIDKETDISKLEFSDTPKFWMSSELNISPHEVRRWIAESYFSPAESPLNVTAEFFDDNELCFEETRPLTSRESIQTNTTNTFERTYSKSDEMKSESNKNSSETCSDISDITLGHNESTANVSEGETRTYYQEVSYSKQLPKRTPQKVTEKAVELKAITQNYNAPNSDNIHDKNSELKICFEKLENELQTFEKTFEGKSNTKHNKPPTFQESESKYINENPTNNENNDRENPERIPPKQNIVQEENEDLNVEKVVNEKLHSNINEQHTDFITDRNQFETDSTVIERTANKDFPEYFLSDDTRSHISDFDYSLEIGNEITKRNGSNKDFHLLDYRNTFKFIARTFSPEYILMDILSDNVTFLDKHSRLSINSGVKITPEDETIYKEYECYQEWLFILQFNSLYWKNNPNARSGNHRFESFYFKKYLNDSHSYNTTLILQNGEERHPKMTSYLTRLLHAESLNLLSRCVLCEGSYVLRREVRPFSKCFYCTRGMLPAFTVKNTAVENVVKEDAMDALTTNKNEPSTSRKGIKVQYLVNLNS